MWPRYTNCRRLLRRFILIQFITCCIYYLVASSVHQTPEEDEQQATIGPITSQTKTILIFNGKGKYELEVFGEGRHGFRRAKCPIDDCYITRNRSFTDTFDAVIINIATAASFVYPKNVNRTSRQRFVLFSQEAPTLPDDEMRKYNDFFNWTMTYQHASDLPYIYGRVVALANAPHAYEARKYIGRVSQGHNYGRDKTKLAVFFNSRCYTPSRREEYVRLLGKHIKVDTFGRCSQQQCSMDNATKLSSDQCYDMVERHYKFYLAFENSLCQDYVTERFFDILERHIVPVVYGGADYAAIAPPHSYIDASHYSPEELAEHLHSIAANDTLYNEYHWWRPYFRVERRYPLMANRVMCQLCRQLHLNQSTSMHLNLEDHFSRNSQCHPPDFRGVPTNISLTNFIVS